MVGRLAFLICVLSFTGSSSVLAQSNRGWLFLSHTQKITQHIDLLADVQFRTAKEWKGYEAVLLRGAVNYNLDNAHSVATGYAFLGEWEETMIIKEYSREHRVFQQYAYQLTWKKIDISLRARLEQRFQKEDKMIFSQRWRGFASMQVPLIRINAGKENIYIKLQDELFLTVQHADQVSGSIFDQNRPYTAIGFRTGKKLDMEIGYMRWQQREKDGDQISHVFQVMITTNF